MEQQVKTKERQDGTAPKERYAGTEVQIGGGHFGVRPLAQHGTILIENGRVTLLDSQKQLIARAPIAQCNAYKTPWYLFNDGAWLIMQNMRYFVSIAYFGPLSNPATIKQKRGEATLQFIDILSSLH